MRVVSEFDNGLLKRKEMQFVFSTDSNPGLEVVKQKVAEKMGVGEDVIVLQKVGSGFGSSDFLIDALVYNSVDDLKRIEPKKKEKKKDGGKK